MNVSRTRLLGLGLVIFVGALWLHWPAVQGDFLTGMDDDKYLQQAERLHGLTWNAVKWAFTDTQPYYHPLPRLSHILDYQIWKTNAAGHHATSVIVHALNAALVFGFLWTLLGAVSLAARRAARAGLRGRCRLRDSSTASRVGGLDVGPNAITVYDIWDRLPLGVRRRRAQMARASPIRRGVVKQTDGGNIAIRNVGD